FPQHSALRRFIPGGTPVPAVCSSHLKTQMTAVPKLEPPPLRFFHPRRLGICPIIRMDHLSSRESSRESFLLINDQTKKDNAITPVIAANNNKSFSIIIFP